MPQASDFEILDCKAVKLMSVDCDVPLPGVHPFVLLVNAYAHQVRHDFCQPVVMIALNPDHFHVELGIGQLAYVAQELPVLFGEAAEIQVSEHVPQQDQATESRLLQEFQRIGRPAYFRTQVQVRKDDRVIVLFLHTLCL